MQTTESVQKKRSNQAIARATSIVPAHVVAELEKHILVDGFKLVVDLEKSRGSRLVDAATGRSFIDFYSFYASMPVGFNHPYFNSPGWRLISWLRPKSRSPTRMFIRWPTRPSSRLLPASWARRHWRDIFLSTAAPWRSRTHSRPPWTGRCGKIWRRDAVSAAPRFC